MNDNSPSWLLEKTFLESLPSVTLRKERSRRNKERLWLVPSDWAEGGAWGREKREFRLDLL